MNQFIAALSKAIIIWVAFGLFGEQLSHAYALGNELTDTGDAYSEANDVRAGEGYAAMGLTSNVGLAEVSYGTAFESQGGKHDTLLCDSPVKCVYLHYPPLPELCMGVMTKLFGSGHVFGYRLLPMTLGLTSLLAVGFALVHAIGPLRAALVIWLLGRVPMTSNMMHVFTTHEYATGFFLLEAAAVIFTFSQPTTRRSHLVAIAAAAFCEGWTSFDHAFILFCAPIVAFLLGKDLRNPTSRHRLLLVLSTLAGAYVLAFVMHFLQVALFLGGLGKAFANFAAAAKNRSIGPSWVHPPIGGASGLILYYWGHLLPDKKFYDGNFIALLALTIAIVWPKRLSMTIGRSWRVSWRSEWSHLGGFLVALVGACIWLVLMQQHSSIHGHFIPRLFESVVLWAYVLIVRSFALEPIRSPAEHD
jgi:hypothetical protein